MLGGGKPWGIGAVENEDRGVFAIAGVATEHLSDVILDLGVVISAASGDNIGDAIDSAGGHEGFWIDER